MKKKSGRVLALLAASLTASLWTQAGGEGLLESLSRKQHFEARRASSSNPDITKNGDGRGVKAGETRVLMDEDGPGIVTHFWNTIASQDPFVSRSLVLRVYYDHQEKPSVQAPLGDFFGVGHGAAKNFTSLPVTVSSHGRSRTCYWRMPFRGHIKITLSNDSQEYDLDSFYYYIDWQKHEALPEDSSYLHALYRQETPAQPGNYTILETKGEGHYVGTVHSAFHLDSGWYGEGDDFFYIDGAATPQLKGTGTEDYFNDAWGFREFCTPYHGVTLYDGVLTGDRVSAYRWHLQDPIPFRQSLKVEMEHRGSIFNDQGSLLNFELGGFEERSDWVSSVAFWYQNPPRSLEEAMPPLEKRTPPYRLLKADTLTRRTDPPLMVVGMDGTVVYMPTQPEASIEFDFDLEQDGRYRIDAQCIMGVIAGVYQPLIDGKEIGAPIDFGIINMDPVWFALDTHELKAGTHTLRFESRGESPKRRALLSKIKNAFGIGSITLVRLEDVEGYQATMKKLLKK